MIIEGILNPKHLLTVFLIKEYGFSIIYPNHEIRIGHRKGIWYCAKIKNNQVIDFVEINDEIKILNARNELTKSVLETVVEQEINEWEGEEKGFIHNRNWMADMLIKFLKIWGGKMSEIQKISVVQPGRNSSIDEFTGNFDFNPREEEWDK